MKNHVIVIFLIVLLCAGPHASGADSAVVNQANPNIILILVDDMGYSDVGCFGGEIETPNIDRLAKSGLRFTQFYNTGKCFPSRACLPTGVYAQQICMDSRLNKRQSCHAMKVFD